MTKCNDSRHAPDCTCQEDVWSEHPEFKREGWRAEAAHGDTNLGYWEWVGHQRQLREEERARHTATTRFQIDVTYDPTLTDPEALSNAFDVLFDTARSTPGILDEYGPVEAAAFYVEKMQRNYPGLVQLLSRPDESFLGSEGHNRHHDALIAIVLYASERLDEVNAGLKCSESEVCVNRHAFRNITQGEVTELLKALEQDWPREKE